MKYKVTMLVFPYGYGYVLGDDIYHDEEYFRKTWDIIPMNNGFAAQDKHRGLIWDIKCFDDELNPIENPCKSCEHEFFTDKKHDYDGFSIVIEKCKKCELKKSDTVLS